jgi:hypothetical protein
LKLSGIFPGQQEYTCNIPQEQAGNRKTDKKYIKNNVSACRQKSESFYRGIYYDNAGRGTPCPDAELQQKMRPEFTISPVYGSTFFLKEHFSHCNCLLQDLYYSFLSLFC